jgi:hypothetical protein
MIAGEMAPKWCAKVSKREAFDADLHAGNLTDWQQEYDQTSRGNFHGSIVELALGDRRSFENKPVRPCIKSASSGPTPFGWVYPRTSRKRAASTA